MKNEEPAAEVRHWSLICIQNAKWLFLHILPYSVKQHFFLMPRDCVSDFQMFVFSFYGITHCAQSRCAASRNFRNKSKYAKLDCGLFKASIHDQNCHNTVLLMTQDKTKGGNVDLMMPLVSYPDEHQQHPLPREYWMIYRGPGFLAGPMILLLVHPLPLSRQKGRPAAHRKTEKDRQLAHGRGGEGGGRGTESFDRREAWAFTNHSILSAPPPPPELVRKKRYCR
jgi:hypothetical protein